MEKNTGVVAYVTSLVTAISATVSLEHMALYIGIATSVATFALNWFYKARADKRDQARKAPHGRK